MADSGTTCVDRKAGGVSEVAVGDGTGDDATIGDGIASEEAIVSAIGEFGGNGAPVVVPIAAAWAGDDIGGDCTTVSSSSSWPGALLPGTFKLSILSLLMMA